MTTPHAILLIPAADIRRHLFKEGPCGARPPAIYGFRLCDEHGPGWRETDGWTDDHCDHCQKCVPQRALVLALDGEPVPEGMDRLMRALDFRPTKQPPTMGTLAEWVFGDKVEGWGVPVLLDADGKEMRR